MGNFWPDNITESSEKPPLFYLRQVAQELSDKTKGLIVADIQPATTTTKELIYILSAIAPALNNYEYEITRIQHNITCYPVYMRSDGKTVKCENEKEYLQALRQLLSTPTVQKVISSLIAQSKV